MTNTVRDSWSKPELIALVRESPAESVLSMCKTGAGGSGPSGPNDYDGYCYDVPSCNLCSAPSAS